MKSEKFYDQLVEELQTCPCMDDKFMFAHSLGIKLPCSHWDDDLDPAMIQDAYKRRAKREKIKTYIYLVTFTIDPAKHPHITDELCGNIEDYIKNQRKRTAMHITDMYMVKELHKNGRPHWHTCITCTKAIRSDAFRQYERVFGKVDISRNKHTNDTDILVYMSKDSDPINIQ